MNILLFFEYGKFVESEVKLSKLIVRCCVYVERVNVRFKRF